MAWMSTWSSNTCALVVCEFFLSYQELVLGFCVFSCLENLLIQSAIPPLFREQSKGGMANSYEISSFPQFSRFFLQRTHKRIYVQISVGCLDSPASVRRRQGSVCAFLQNLNFYIRYSGDIFSARSSMPPARLVPRESYSRFGGEDTSHIQRPFLVFSYLFLLAFIC